MRRDQLYSAGSQFRLVFILLTIISIKQGFVANPKWYWLGGFTLAATIVSFLFSRKRPAKAKQPGCDNAKEKALPDAYLYAKPYGFRPAMTRKTVKEREQFPE